DELVIPNHFVDRKWDVLLCLEGDDPLNFFLVDRRQFYKAREDRLFRHGVVDVSAFDMQFVQHFAQGGDNLCASRCLRRGIGQEFSGPITAEDQPALRLSTKLRQFDALRTEIKSGDACPGGHSTKEFTIWSRNASLKLANLSLSRVSEKILVTCRPVSVQVFRSIAQSVDLHAENPSTD